MACVRCAAGPYRRKGWRRCPGPCTASNASRSSNRARNPKLKLDLLVKIGELVFFPSQCRLCGRLLERRRERLVCRSCLDRLRPDRRAGCRLCGRFLSGAGKSFLCGDCLGEPPLFSCHRSAALYRGMLKDLILLFKYRRLEPLGRDLARFAWKALGGEAGLWRGAEAVTAVPLHRRRQRERGFNQSGVLAGEIARLVGLPQLDRCLVRIKPIPPQTGLPADARRRNVAGAFSVRRKKDVAGRILILVDDVYTTGSTVRECCRVLAGAGAREVRVLTLARAQT